MTTAPFQIVTRYATVDGREFKTVKEAIDHAGNETGVKLQALIKEAQAAQKIVLDAKEEFRLCQFMIANAEKFTRVLSAMTAFDLESRDD